MFLFSIAFLVQLILVAETDFCILFLSVQLLLKSERLFTSKALLMCFMLCVLFQCTIHWRRFHSHSNQQQQELADELILNCMTVYVLYQQVDAKLALMSWLHISFSVIWFLCRTLCRFTLITLQKGHTAPCTAPSWSVAGMSRLKCVISLDAIRDFCIFFISFLFYR